MRHRFAVTLILLFYFTALPCGVLASEPKNPDSLAYKKCMANCNTPGTKEYKMKRYLRSSCEDVCYSAEDELADLYITVINKASGERIGAFFEVTGPGGFSEKGSMGEDHFRDLKAGVYTVKVEMIYFLPQELTVNIDPAKSKKNEIKVFLQPDPDGSLEKSTLAAVPEKDCPERFCHGNTLHYNGQFDPVSGDCVSFSRDCKLGCDASTSQCNQSALELRSVSFDAPRKGLILNGRSKMILTGRATYENPNNESLEGQEIAIASVVPTSAGEKKPRLLGIRSFTAWVKKDGRFSMEVLSEKPVDPKIKAKGLELLVRVKDHPNMNTTVQLISPAPVITQAALKNRNKMENQRGMWQETYGVFNVVAEDPDNEITSYTISSKHGTIRIYQEDWDGHEQKTVSTTLWPNKNQFEFGWKSPPMTEHLKLNLLRDLRGEWESAVKDMAASTLKKAGEKAVGISLSEEDANLIDPDAADNFMNAAHNKDVQGGNWQLLKYGLSIHPSAKMNAAGNVISATEGLYDTYKDVEEHTGDQAAKMGEAYESGHEFYKEEMAARLFSIFIDGVKLNDGVHSFAMQATGKGDDSLAGSLKSAVEGATIGSLQKGAEYMANTYKAAGARIKTLPFFIEVTATDRDGYTGTRKIFVEVSGYESLIQ